MSVQTSGIAGSLQRAQMVQRIHSGQQDAERAAAKQTAGDIERLARAAEEQVSTSAPTAGKNVHERDAGQGSDYVPQRRRRKDEPPPDPSSEKPPSNPPDEGTLIDIEA